MSIDFISLYKEDFIMGFLTTIFAGFLGLLLSVMLGFIVAALRLSPFKIIQTLALCYIEFFRNIPLVIIAFFFYFGMPSIGVNMSGFTCGILGISIYNSAFIAEIIRSGIQAIPKGQAEAARSTGISYIQCMIHIIFPQAIRIAIPPLGNQFINIVKGTSILGVIAGGDLMYHADIVASNTFEVFNIYIFIAVLYLALTIPLSMGVDQLQKKMSKQYGS